MQYLNEKYKRTAHLSQNDRYDYKILTGPDHSIIQFKPLQKPSSPSPASEQQKKVRVGAS